MTTSKDPTIAVYSGLTVRLDADTGMFYTDEEGKSLRSKSLGDLKKKIDQRTRLEARQRAADLPVVALAVSYHYDDEWIEGMFAGVNAHTGEIAVMVDGKRRTLSGSSWLFRKADPRLPEIRKLIAAAGAAEKKAEDARKIAEAAIEAAGRQARKEGRRSKSTGDAADVEEAIVRFLSGEEK